MKKMLFFIILCMYSLYIGAQPESDFHGSWQISYNSLNSNILTLNKEKSDLDALEFGHWGRFIEFEADGTYREHASAQCGLDDNRYSYSGKWKYDASTKTIELNEIKVENGRPNIYNSYKVLSSGKLQVLSMKPGVATLKIIKPWEKVNSDK